MAKRGRGREYIMGKGSVIPRVKRLPTLEEDVTPRPPKSVFNIPLVGDWRGTAERRRGVAAMEPITREYPIERGGFEEGVGDVLPLVIAGVAILAFAIILPRYMPRTA